MAKEALDTCYKAREIDFGNRKFDTPNAVKLINGVVKRGVAVSEGDALWSAVENFAPPLGIVRAESPKRLDPGASPFYQEIQKKIEDAGALGIDIRTVYNWFTGYNSSDGQESMGLTRRMVDVYLLCLAQKRVANSAAHTHQLNHAFRIKHHHGLDSSSVTTTSPLQAWPPSYGRPRPFSFLLAGR